MDPMEVEGSAGAHTRPAQDDSASNQEVGVGIVFQPLDDGTLYVKRLKEGEPAARSGLIKIGDCLCEINGRDVFRKPVEEVKRILLGPPGSTVRLGLHRGTDPRTPLIQVALQRCLPGQQLVGVGLIFRSDATGALFVRQLQDGEPAKLSGQVRVGDCIVEVDGADVYRKPIGFFTKLMLGPPGSLVTLGFRRAGASGVTRVMLRRSVPAQRAGSAGEEAVGSSNVALALELSKERVEQERLKTILEERRDRLREAARVYAKGASAMGGRMSEEAQRLETFSSWPHSSATHPGVTPAILAADGFYFSATAQDRDTVVCFFCDLQLGDWERSDDAKVVHRKLSPSCPIVVGLPCGNVPKAAKTGGSALGPFASPQERLEEVLSGKAVLLQSVTSLEAALDDARRQIAAAVQARKRLQQDLTAILARSAQGPH